MATHVAHRTSVGTLPVGRHAAPLPEVRQRSWRLPSRQLLKELLSWTGLVVILGVVVVCVGWRVQGGRWERVETASMGTVAPVGTLLWVKPVDFASLEPGDFITFSPPSSKDVTYSHRVLRRNADGTILTKGVLSAPDPWHLTEADVIGKVRMHWWGAGWLLAAAPVLVLGVVAMALAQRLLPKVWKPPALVLLGSVVLSIVIVWQRPLVNAQQLAFSPSAGGGADATYVGTGLLPIRVTAADGQHVELRAGEVGTVHVAQADRAGWLRVTLEPVIRWWWWALLVGACFVPAFAGTVRGRRRALEAAAGNLSV